MTEEEKKLYLEGYTACERKYGLKPKDIPEDTGLVSQDWWQEEVKDWFKKNCPDWGLVLKTNRWQYFFADFFYRKGKMEGKMEGKSESLMLGSKYAEKIEKLEKEVKRLKKENHDLIGKYHTMQLRYKELKDNKKESDN